MRITKKQMKRIIREEKQILNEQPPSAQGAAPQPWDRPEDNKQLPSPTPERVTWQEKRAANAQIEAARRHLDNALRILEDMGYEDAADFVLDALNSL